MAKREEGVVVVTGQSNHCEVNPVVGCFEKIMQVNVMLKDRIERRESGYLFYGLTPPKINTDEERIKAIADKQIERLSGVDIDALVLYDI